MTKLRITEPIINEVFCRELWDREHEGKGMSVYSKIAKTKSTRKDGSIYIEVNNDELTELKEEADYWSDSFDEYMMSRGEWMAWRALGRQCRKG